MMKDLSKLLSNNRLLTRLVTTALIATAWLIYFLNPWLSYKTVLIVIWSLLNVLPSGKQKSIPMIMPIAVNAARKCVPPASLASPMCRPVTVAHRVPTMDGQATLKHASENMAGHCVQIAAYLNTFELPLLFMKRKAPSAPSPLTSLSY